MNGVIDRRKEEIGFGGGFAAKRRQRYERLDRMRKDDGSLGTTQSIVV
jgi:hypothetical protein